MCVAATGDHDDWFSECLERLFHRVEIRGFAIVVESYAISAFATKLNAMLDTFERQQSLTDCFVGCTDKMRSESRGQGVLQVVSAGNGQLPCCEDGARLSCAIANDNIAFQHVRARSVHFMRDVTTAKPPHCCRRILIKAFTG